MASTTSNHLIPQDFLETFRSRRLLLSAPSPANEVAANTTFDTDVVMVLSVLLCALICSLGLNSIIKCALRCSSIVSGPTTTDSNNQSSSANSAKQANTGIKKKALKTFPVITYAADVPGLDTECAICLSEFAAGERVRVLPKCHHGFHVRCVDKWLTSHSSCPTCRNCLIQTCQKIVGCTTAATAAVATQPPTPPTPPPAAVEETVVVRIEPLNREDLIPNYHN